MNRRIPRPPDRAGAGRLLSAGHLLLVPSLLIWAGGCDDDHVANPERRLDVQRAECRREVARLRAELSQRNLEARGLEADFRGAVLIWGSTAVTLLVALLLLAKERRGRRVVDRLLRMILHRVGRARSPPDEP